MTAVATAAILVVAGLAIDLGRFFVVRAQLSKAVDGAALAGARVLPAGESRAVDAAEEYARMNFDVEFMSARDTQFTVSFTPVQEAARVSVRGTAEMPLTFMRLVGLDQVTVPAFAEAERRPLAVALVLDNSYSLHPSFAGVDAIAYLRTAAENFVWYFDDEMDQMALTLFSTGTELRSPLDHGFKASITPTIRSMSPHANTNLSDGFVSGYRELRRGASPAALKVLVFFTDGRPTALRAQIPVGATTVDAVIAGDQDPNGHVYDDLFDPHRLDRAIPGARYPSSVFPDGTPKTTANLQALAAHDLRRAAAGARAEAITVYAIGLGNPHHGETWVQPDVRLLMEMANAPYAIDPRDGGVIQNPNYDPSGPEGGVYFAPDPAQLSDVFEQVARDIVLRLVQ
jgi:hypothetical protein